jgi:hypothetical protein
MERLLSGKAFARKKIMLGLIIVVLLVGLAAWVYVTRRQSPSGNKPAIHMSGPNLPTLGASEPQAPLYPQEETPAYPMQNPDVIATPLHPGPSNPPPLHQEHAEGKGGTYKLAAPVTEVHSLSEAESVMGRPLHGEIGVPRVMPLPSQVNTRVGTVDLQSVNGPVKSAVEDIGAPPGVDPQDIGKQKTIPMPKDDKGP